jgi:cytochrome c1
VARRVYLAGVLPNSPVNMVRWIRAPQSIKPQTAMPNLQVAETHATDMMAYLYRLR